MSVSTLGGRDALPEYRVLSIEKDGAAEAEGHTHVFALSTSDPDGGETRWSLVQVIAAIRDGERFVLEDGRAAIEPAVCPRCSYATLVVEPVNLEPARTF